MFKIKSRLYKLNQALKQTRFYGEVEVKVQVRGIKRLSLSKKDKEN